MHHVVEVVVVVNVAADVHSVMADHFGYTLVYCLNDPQPGVVNLCEFAIILTWQVVGCWSHTSRTP